MAGGKAGAKTNKTAAEQKPTTRERTAGKIPKKTQRAKNRRPPNPPRRWLTDPAAFGVNPKARWKPVPAGATTTDARKRAHLAAAWRQHQFFAGVTANTDPARATKPLTRTQIAVELGWSPDYLNRRWNGDQRCRFSDYVEILEAIHRLRNEAIPLSEVFVPLDSARELYPPPDLTGSP